MTEARFVKPSHHHVRRFVFNTVKIVGSQVLTLLAGWYTCFVWYHPTGDNVGFAGGPMRPSDAFGIWCLSQVVLTVVGAIVGTELIGHLENLSRQDAEETASLDHQKERWVKESVALLQSNGIDAKEEDFYVR